MPPFLALVTPKTTKKGEWSPEDRKFSELVTPKTVKVLWNAVGRW